MYMQCLIELNNYIIIVSELLSLQIKKYASVSFHPELGIALYVYYIIDLIKSNKISYKLMPSIRLMGRTSYQISNERNKTRIKNRYIIS